MTEPNYMCPVIDGLQLEASQLWERNEKHMPTDSKDWNSVMYICMMLDVLRLKVEELRRWGRSLLATKEEKKMIKFIYQRLVKVHKEDSRADYMISLNKYYNKIK